MRTITNLGARLAHQPQIGLVHQRRGLERVPGPLAAQTARREPAQLVVDQREDLVEHLGAAGAPLLEQERDLAGRAARTIAHGPEPAAIT